MTEGLYQKMMVGWALCFLMVGIVFIVVPDGVIQLLNVSAVILGCEARLPLTNQYLWWALSGAMMMTIAYLSFAISRHPLDSHLVNALLICKGSSSLLFLWAAFKLNILYGIGTVVDFPIFLIILLSTYWFRKTISS